jgi:hypothetical protein
MEEESFEDLEIARYLNQQFVCIKIDREERPDIDAIYMTAVQAIAGNGGWPLNVMVTDQREPFWGGTYFPARDGDRGATLGFLSILQRIAQVYSQTPSEIRRSCRQLTEAIEHYLSPPAGKNIPGVELLDEAVAQYKTAFDPVNGGIKGAPKFPSSLPVRFLLRAYCRTGQTEILEMVNLSLKKMAAGGIYDHVGGGFHRYSTDATWLVPHFEKMLYDNALLAVSFIEGYQVLGDESFKSIAVAVLEYILREMTAESGAFYSATDADSLTEAGEQEEGYFFTWTVPELRKVLEEKEFQIACMVWGISDSGNFEGRSILHTNTDLAEAARLLKIPEPELLRKKVQIVEMLYGERQKRLLPLRDEKIIVSWNGLMISAFATVGSVLADQTLIAAAVKAAEFIKNNLVVAGRLYRTFKDGAVKHKAFLSDYTNLLAACLDLFQATQDISWLQFALELDNDLHQLFEDQELGGFYRTGSDQEVLITREKPASDGALPSGNAVALQNLLRLQALTLNDSYRKRFEKTLSCFLGKETGGLAGYSDMLVAWETSCLPPIEIVISTVQDKSEAAPFLRELRRRFLPRTNVIVLSQQANNQDLEHLVPFAANRSLTTTKTTAFICQNGRCQLPLVDLDRFASQLNDLSTHQFPRI